MNNFIIANQHKYSLTPYNFRQTFLRKGRVIPVLLLLLISLFITLSPACADLQQAFTYGQAGRFQQAHSKLQELSDELESQVSSADITVVGRNCAAIGFYSILSQISSDCISKKLGHEHGQKLFTAARNAASGRLDKGGSLAKEVVAAKPNYLLAQLLLARIRMQKCMQFNQGCNATIKTYQQVIRMDDTVTVAYLDLGMLYQHMGKDQEAISVWENCVRQSRGDTATKTALLMLSLLYSKEEKWMQAKKYAEKARELGFTGLAAELLAEIQRKTSVESTSGEQKASMAQKNDSNAIEPNGKQDSEPDFFTGFGHGLTSPLRTFGIFDLHFKQKKNWTDSYTLGLVIGGLVILSLLAGLFKGKGKS